MSHGALPSPAGSWRWKRGAHVSGFRGWSRAMAHGVRGRLWSWQCSQSNCSLKTIAVHTDNGQRGW